MHPTKENPRLSAPKLNDQIDNDRGKRCSSETVRRELREHDFNSRVTRKEPFVSKKIQVSRLNFAKEHISKSANFWNNVIFADKSKFNIFGSAGMTNVW